MKGLFLTIVSIASLNLSFARANLEYRSDNGEIYSLVNEKFRDGEVDYVKLKMLNLSGTLSALEPIEVCYDELMISISEFTIFHDKKTKQVTIGLDHLSNTEVKIYNETGKLMTQIIINDLELVKVEVDVSKFPAGKYTASDGLSTLTFTVD